MPSLTKAQIVAGTKGNINLQQSLLAVYDQIDMLNQASGTNFLQPVNSTQKPASAVPASGALSVTGGNGAFAIAATNPAQSVNKLLYVEYSYSAQANFQSGATALPVSTATALNYAMPGASVYWRARWSYDQQNWSSYAYVAGIVNAGLQSSAATSNATALNITNYATVDSVPNGVGSSNVRVYGTAGPQTMWPAVKGASETILPSATIINVASGTQPFVAYDGEQFVVRNTLPQVFADDLVPVGQVGTPAGGAVTEPTVTATVAAGKITGYVVTSGGANLSADVTLTITDATGSGAVPGPQTIVGGVLTAVAPGLPGTSYTAPTVAVSGGRAAASPGGGGVTGQNPGRYIPTL